MQIRDTFFPALLEMVQRLEGINLSTTLGHQTVLPSKLTFESNFFIRTIPSLHLGHLGGLGAVLDALNASICWVWVEHENNDPISGKKLKMFLEDSESQLTQLKVQIANRSVGITFVGDRNDPNKLIAIGANAWETQPYRDRTAITIAINFVTDETSDGVINPCEFMLQISEAQSTIHKTEPIFKHANALRKRINEFLGPQKRYLWDQLSWLNDPNSKRRIAYELSEEPGVLLFSNEREIPQEFQTSGTRFKILNAKRQPIWKISRFDHETETIRLSELRIRQLGEWPPSGIPLQGLLESCENTSPNWLKRRTIQELTSVRFEEWQKLLQILIAPSDLPPFTPEDVEFFDPRIQHGTQESGDQARAVEMALSTPDCVLIQGPPGTGKTTVICEIIRQAIHRGERILMVAPTHIAVDHVLEQVGSAEGIVTIRLGLPSKVGSKVEKYTLEERAKSLFDQIRTELAQVHEEGMIQNEDILYSIQREWFEYLCQRSEMIGEHDPIQKLLLLNANLICATTIGIGSFKELPFAPVFDLLIIDEASKANLVDLLVPALRAKRWVIVGDHLQLSPFVDRDEIIAILASRLFADENSSQTPKEFWDLKREDRYQFLERADEIFWRYQQIFEERMGDPDRQQRYWQDLEESFGITKRIKHTLVEIQQTALISCFEYFQNLFEKAAKERIIQLRCQHRMNPEIAEFLKEEIYFDYFSSEHAKKHTTTIESDVFTFHKPLTLIDTSSSPFTQREEKLRKRAKGKYYNPLEASLIVKSLRIIHAWAQKYPKPPIKTIGVITFYREQAKEIRNHLNRAREVQRKARYLYQLRDTPIEVEVSVVDRFQGREKDLIILSFTRSNRKRTPGFIRNLNRLNVAISRARYMVLMIGDSSTLSRIQRDRKSRTPILTALIKHIDRKDGVIDVLQVSDHFSDRITRSKTYKRFRKRRKNYL